MGGVNVVGALVLSKILFIVAIIIVISFCVVVGIILWAALKDDLDEETRNQLEWMRTEERMEDQREEDRRNYKNEKI